MKGKLTLSIDKEVKDKAKACMNISEEVENILKEKTLEEKTIEVIKEGKYIVALIPNNWVVYESSNNRKFNMTFHITLSQAIIQLSKRLFEDKVSTACKDKELELKELIRLVEEHHEYILSLTRGV